jgi:CTP:molybdopterin cytidylyltransferase MocA
MTTRVAGILLAAGEGSRLGQPKALVELGGQTLAQRGVATLLGGGADPVLVVTGAVRVSVAGAWTVRNLDWRTGMGSSLAAGLHALDAPHGPGDPEPARGLDPEAAVSARGSSPADWGWEASGSDVSAAVIALADQPLVGAEVVRRLIAAYGAGAPVVVAAYDGRPRNPVLIGREHWAAVLKMAVGDTGARPFLRARPELVTLVECGDIGGAFDIDTPADLARVAADWPKPPPA